MGPHATVERPVRILCLFDYACNTGFSTVSTQIVKALRRVYKKNIRLDILAGNYFGPPYYEHGGDTAVLPASITCLPEQEQDRDAYGRNVFCQMLRYDDYDGCFIIQDPDVILGDYGAQDGGIAKMIQIIRDERRKEGRKQFRAMFYFPVDCEPMRYLFEQKYIDVFDELITYTDFGLRQVLKIRPDLKGRVKTILHGVDVSTFHPVTDLKIRNKYRCDYFAGQAHKYIISNINRNQYRKDIPSTLYAFKEFKEAHCPKAFLYLHMHPRDAMGWDIRQVAEQLGLKENEDYMLPPAEMLDASGAVNASPAFLNILYNISDVYLTTTTGEGFGLTILEAMATGLAVVAPLHTSISEIGDNGARIYGFEDFYYYCSRGNNKIVWQCDFEEVARQLKNAYDDHLRDGNELKAGKAMDYAHELQWGMICNRWVTEFQNLFGSNVSKKFKLKR